MGQNLLRHERRKEIQPRTVAPRGRTLGDDYRTTDPSDQTTPISGSQITRKRRMLSDLAQQARDREYARSGGVASPLPRTPEERDYFDFKRASEGVRTEDAQDVLLPAPPQDDLPAERAPRRRGPDGRFQPERRTLRSLITKQGGR